MRGRTDPLERAARTLQRAWPGVVAGDAEAVHRARVATRRLREALPLAGGGERPARQLRRDLRALTCTLGPLRELDVSLGLVVELMREEPGFEPALELVREALMERRVRRRARALPAIEALDVSALAGAVVDTVEPPPSHAGEGTGHSAGPVSAQAARRRMERRAAQLRAALDQAGPLYAPEPLHAVRIAVKKLRYAVELAQSAGVPGVARDARRLKRVQDLLGGLHDWQVLADHVGRVQTAAPLGDDCMSDLTTLLSHVEDRCRARHGTFVAQRSGLQDLCDRLTSTFASDGASCSQS